MSIFGKIYKLREKIKELKDFLESKLNTTISNKLYDYPNIIFNYLNKKYVYIEMTFINKKDCNVFDSPLQNILLMKVNDKIINPTNIFNKSTAETNLKVWANIGIINKYLIQNVFSNVNNIKEIKKLIIIQKVNSLNLDPEFVNTLKNCDIYLNVSNVQDYGDLKSKNITLYVPINQYEEYMSFYEDDNIIKIWET